MRLIKKASLIIWVVFLLFFLFLSFLHFSHLAAEKYDYVSNPDKMETDEGVIDRATEFGQINNSGGTLFSTPIAFYWKPQDLELEQTIIDDFLVNDDTTGGCDQKYPHPIHHPSGGFIIAWTNYSSIYPDIFFQRYDTSGLPIDSVIKVNDDFGSANQHVSKLAIDKVGNFVITWYDDRNGNLDIYAQRYDSSCAPLGSNFKVNNDVGSSDQYVPAVTLDSSGSFVITWYDKRNGDRDIYAQRYNSSGIPLGSNFKVNDDAGSADQMQTSIASEGSGNFIICWADMRNGSYDIYAQRYSSAGVPLGSNFKVNEDVGYPSDASPDVAMANTGNFIITWERSYDIYAQRYDSSGNLLGSNFKVNDDSGTVEQRFPEIAMNNSGEFVITWQDSRGYENIYAQRYDSSGVPLGSNFKVNEDTGSAYTSQNEPDISIDDSGNFVITWYDNRNGNYDIYAQKYESDGIPSDSNFKVYEDAGTANQVIPDIAADSSGNFIITWYDNRNGNYDIYAQICNSSGNPIGTNFKVNDDTGLSQQYHPCITSDRLGNFIISWDDMRNGNYDVYAQRYTSSGTPLGLNFLVNDDSGNSSQMSPAIAMDRFGHFVINWQDRRNASYDIYAQRFDSSGTPIGQNFKVSDDLGTANQQFPAIAIDGSGGFVITWEDQRNYISTYYDIYAQRYDSSGNPLGSNFNVDVFGGATRRGYPDIAVDHLGNFVIVWKDEEAGNYDILAQRFDSGGSALGSNFRVNDDLGTAIQEYPAIAMDDSGYFVITWEDERNGSYGDIYAQKYNPSGNPQGNNYLVSNPQHAFNLESTPEVYINNSNIYFAWSDTRRAKGWDIYSKVVDWNWTEVEDEQVVSTPKSFELLQNYPNPFNPECVIRYSLHKDYNVKLSIYNIIGQVVKVLVDEYQLAGNKLVKWDGRDDYGREIASGVYFYRLQAGEYVEAKKMMLLK